LHCGGDSIGSAGAERRPRRVANHPDRSGGLQVPDVATTSSLSPEIRQIQERVVGMYSEHPWPLNRNADEEMGWRLKCLGIGPEDYQGRRVLEMGCGTGEYALWYAMHGAGSVTGIDLSDGSLAIAKQRRAEAGLDGVELLKMDILNCTLPDNHFDYSYSVGVLHHTGDAFRGFQHLVRTTKPGGVVIVSVHNAYARRVLRTKQTICKWLGGDDIDKRVEWGEKLFRGTMRKLDKRYHGVNTKQIAYDIFGFPHDTMHTAGEILRWFDQTNVDYKGAFPPLRLQDYLFAFAQPEYQVFRSTFAGFPVTRLVTDAMSRLARATAPSAEAVRKFPRPSAFSRGLVQSIWIPFGLRFHCFTLSGIKRA
jgi:ubiquinone/menaquinone biosynthesis C-methylase UbiE